MPCKNASITCDGRVLTIVVDLAREVGLSKAKRSIIVGTTGGNITIPNAAGFKVCLNVIKEVKRTAPSIVKNA
nr:hypothetical protein [Candidatus Sigynarchaeota archaeon]